MQASFYSPARVRATYSTQWLIAQAGRHAFRNPAVGTSTEEDRSAIVTPLLAHNLANGGDDALETFALLLWAPDSDDVIGGLYGKISYRWLLIGLVRVESMRGQGSGQQLMRMGKDIAQKKHCIGIWLETFSFQAPGFYQKLGYCEFGRLTDSPPGHTRMFYQNLLC